MSNLTEVDIKSIDSEVQIFKFFKKLNLNCVFIRPIIVENKKVRELTDILVLSGQNAFVIEIKHFEGKTKVWKNCKATIQKSIKQVNLAENKVYTNKVYKNVDVESFIAKSDYMGIMSLNGYYNYTINTEYLINLSNVKKVFKLVILLNIEKSIKKHKKIQNSNYTLMTTKYPGLYISECDIIKGFEYRYKGSNFTTILTENQFYFIFNYLKQLNLFCDYLYWKESMSSLITVTKEEMLVIIYINYFLNLNLFNFSINNIRDEQIEYFENIYLDKLI